jgi:hypothetical protein
MVLSVSTNSLHFELQAALGLFLPVDIFIFMEIELTSLCHCCRVDHNLEFGRWALFPLQFPPFNANEIGKYG